MLGDAVQLILQACDQAFQGGARQLSRVEVDMQLQGATALLGRLWCGYACPQTVFLDHVYRRIERMIEGDAPARRQLDAAPFTVKVSSRVSGKSRRKGKRPARPPAVVRRTLKRHLTLFEHRLAPQAAVAIHAAIERIEADSELAA